MKALKIQISSLDLYVLLFNMRLNRDEFLPLPENEFPERLLTVKVIPIENKHLIGS